MDSLGLGRGVTFHPLPASLGERLTIVHDQALRDGWCVWVKFVHPCRVKSFRKAVSTVKDDLGKTSEHRQLSELIDNKI
jgi:hypothetical protein